MKNIYLIPVLLLLGASLVVLPSCKKDKNKETAENEEYFEDMAGMEQMYENASDIADQAIEEGNSSLKDESNKPTGCATVTNDTVAIPHLLTIDFGTTNCTGKDGRNRRGKILVSYSGRYKDSGYTHTITFDNYFVNDNQVLGSKQITNMGRNSQGETYYNISINGYVIKANAGDTVSRSCTRTRTWLSGENTRIRLDDVYEIAGTGTMTKANGKVFSVNIMTPLKVAVACNWIKEGIVQITPQGSAARTLDYGNGNCDAMATVTVNGNTRTITLR